MYKVRGFWPTEIKEPYSQKEYDKAFEIQMALEDIFQRFGFEVKQILVRPEPNNGYNCNFNDNALSDFEFKYKACVKSLYKEFTYDVEADLFMVEHIANAEWKLYDNFKTRQMIRPLPILLQIIIEMSSDRKIEI